jgi:nitroimidazol reductase NimA-like FMN-containing flavoprotein (pyridoxamine 5'-phosphate oxidase superfamily)
VPTEPNPPTVSSRPAAAGASAAPSARAEVKRGAIRARYERQSIAAILDDAFLCHVACAVDGHAVVIPMVYVRIGDEVIVHGSSGNRVLRAIAAGAEATLSVMLCDGLVAARSAFHHSVNYRSVTVYGRAREVLGGEKDAALAALVEIVAPGRMADCRAPSESELRRTLVLALPLDEASAKVRAEGPGEEDGDWDLPFWAGVIPLRTTRGRPQPCARLAPGTPLPAYLELEGAPARVR